MNTQSKKSIISIILIMVLLFQFLPISTIISYASSEKRDLENIIYQDDGIINFDSYEGAAKYEYTLGKYKTHYPNSYVCPYFDAMSQGWDAGIYPVTIVAVDEDGNEISNKWVGSYEFVPPHEKLETPQNLKWDGKEATWSNLDDAAQYTVELYDVTDKKIIAFKTAYTSKVDFSEELAWDYCKGKDFTFNVSATSLPDGIGYDTELLEAIMHPDSDKAFGEDIYHVEKEKFNLDNVELSQDGGYLRFGPFYDNYRVKFTFGDIEEYIDNTIYLDLKNLAKEYGLSNGTYTIGLISVDENNNELSNPWTGSYTVNNEYEKLKDPTNLIWAGGNKITWSDQNKAEDVEKYKVEIFNSKTGEIIVKTEVTEKEYDYTSEYNYFQKNATYLFSVQAIGYLCPSSNVSVVQTGVYGWYEKPSLENVVLENSTLSWNSINGASSYKLDINEKKIDTSSTSLDLKEIAESNDFKSGTYTFKLVAIDNKNIEISNTYQGSYEYEKKEVKIEATPNVANFGSVQQSSNEQKDINITIKNTGNVPVTVDNSIPTDKGPFACTWFDNEKVINPNDTIDVTLKYSSSSSFSSIPGYYSGNYVFNAIEYNGSDFYNLEVPASIIITSIPKFTVTFDTDGGTEISKQSISSGSKASKPEDPTKSGRVFAGWYEDSEFTKEFDFDTSINKSITIYAKWNLPDNPVYKVTFNSNGGSNVESIDVEKGNKLNKPSDPTKDNYSFNGWYKEESLTNRFDFENDTITENITLYAKWDELTLKIEANTSLVDFGEYCIPLETDIVKTITIKNTGNIPVTISNTNPSSSGPFGCYWFDPSNVINPNESLNVTLRIADSSSFAGIEGTYNGNYEFIAKSTKNNSEFVTTIKAKVTVNNHSYEDSITKATLSEDGKIEKVCSHCGKKSGEIISIFHPNKFNLSKTSYTYNGKVQKPKITIKDTCGYTIDKSNYDIKYSSGCKKVGEYTVTITFKGKYKGTKKLTYKITPKGTSLSKLTAGSKRFTAKWKKQTTQTTGYEIQYATNSKFTKDKKYAKITNNKTVSKTVKKLKGKKKYYVRIRTYKTVNKKKYFSGWSKAKYITTKK